MELQEEQIQELALNPEQVTKLQEITSSYEAAIKQEWDGKADKDANGILEGALGATLEKFGIQGFERAQGEKIADALHRAAPLVIDSALAKEKSEVARLQREYNDKIANGGGDESLKQELKEAKEKLDIYLQKEAKYSDWEENDYKGKYEETTKELSTLKLNAAYDNVKPSFPEGVNNYEANGRWTEFKEATNKEWVVDIDGKAVNRDNKHITTTLKALIAKDAGLTALTQGRNVRGIGSSGAVRKIEGVPFDVKEGAAGKDIAQAIKEHLLSPEGGETDTTSRTYGIKYGNILRKIKEKTPAK